jgi:hypothetical protein
MDYQYSEPREFPKLVEAYKLTGTQQTAPSLTFLFASRVEVDSDSETGEMEAESMTLMELSASEWWRLNPEIQRHRP